MAVDRPCVSYHAAALYEEDVALLARAGRWLNDATIVFAEEWLAHNEFADSRGITFLHPGTAFLCLFETGGDLLEALAGLQLAVAQLVLIPVNNNLDPTAPASGTHWSLLAFSRCEVPVPGGGRAIPAGFSHWDSVPGSSNMSVARRIAAAVLPALQAPGAATAVTECTAPLQRNSSDCGVHVVWGMAAMARAASSPRGTAAEKGGLMPTDAATAAAGGAGASPALPSCLELAMSREAMAKGISKDLVIDGFRRTLLGAANALRV